MAQNDDQTLADTILLLEHDRFTPWSDTGPDQLARWIAFAASIFTINRGGQDLSDRAVDGYPIIDLRNCGQDLHKYLRWIELC